MISKDSLNIFNIVIDLNSKDTSDSCIPDFECLRLFWDAFTDLAFDILQYGFVVDSLEYHEYDPSMLCVIKSHLQSDSDCKTEIRFRASDSTERLFAKDLFQKYWRNDFISYVLPSDTKFLSCNYDVYVDGTQFETCDHVNNYICDELRKLSNTFIPVSDVPTNLYDVFN